MERRELLQRLPSVDELLGREAVARLLLAHPRPAVVRAVRAAVANARRQILDGTSGASPLVGEAEVAAQLQRERRPGLRPVINATGVVLHTNLGRAPLSAAARDAVAEVARGYSNLELDLATGERGSRYAPLLPLLSELCGAEAAVAVNNNAAAVWLTLAALAEGRECIVSRGELVEIGGGFRIPDVMRLSGCKLVEVGTTNRTRLSDYAGAVGPATALLVKVHRSNFAVSGFTEEVSAAGLAALAREKGLAVYEDLGSGCLTDLRAAGLPHEPTVAEAVGSGADVVSFSGDKLLGGPQAGLIVGRRALIERIARHPLNRALRVDKLTVAALEATLRLYLDGRALEVPVQRMLHASQAELTGRAERLRALLSDAGVSARILPCTSQVGGGSLPTAEPASVALSVEGPAEALHQALREGDPAVVARVHEDRLLLDVRCVLDEELHGLARAVRAASVATADAGGPRGVAK